MYSVYIRSGPKEESGVGSKRGNVSRARLADEIPVADFAIHRGRNLARRKFTKLFDVRKIMSEES